VIMRCVRRVCSRSVSVICPSIRGGRKDPLPDAAGDGYVSRER
jgi:hypothetical protein